MRFSLSPRERVGVRGKTCSYSPVYTNLETRPSGFSSVCLSGLAHDHPMKNQFVRVVSFNNLRTETSPTENNFIFLKDLPTVIRFICRT
jgi:hypothetical protein